MGKSTATFDALAKAQVFRDWIEALRGATGVRLRLRPPCDSKRAPPKSTHSLAARIVIAGEDVASLQSEPLRVPKPGIRAQQRLLTLIARSAVRQQERLDHAKI